MVGLQTLDLAIGVRVPASQPRKFPSRIRAALETSRPFAFISLRFARSVGFGLTQYHANAAEWRRTKRRVTKLRSRITRRLNPDSSEKRIRSSACCWFLAPAWSTERQTMTLREL